jgi:hypothetical protein
MKLRSSFQLEKKVGGGDRNRTGDPLLSRQVLSMDFSAEFSKPKPSHRFANRK